MWSTRAATITLYVKAGGVNVGGGLGLCPGEGSAWEVWLWVNYCSKALRWKGG